MKASTSIAEDVWITSVCGMCPDQCGILVHRVDGVVTKIEGNPESPLGRGRLCARGLAGIQLLYDPHRLNQPLKRGNPEKGIGVDPRWQAIGWDEALETVVERLRQVRAEDPARLLLCGTTVSPEPLAFARRVFLSAFGSPNALIFDGSATDPRYHDPESCEYVLTFGADCVSGAMAERMADARVRGMRTVAVEPFLSPAAEKADEWLPIRPGSEGLLACALLNLLLNEYDLFDVEHVRRHTDGPYLVRPDGSYARDTAGGKPLVWDVATDRAVPLDEAGADVALEGTYEVEGEECRPVFELLRQAVRRWTPEAATEATTIPAETIRRLAREFGEAARIGATVTIDGQELPLRPVAAVGPRDGSPAAQAIALLNEVVGAVDAPGGLLRGNSVSFGQSRPSGFAPAVDPGGLVHESEDADPPTGWPALAERRPEVFIDCGSNLLMSVADPEGCLEALKDCFVVSFGLFSDETAEALADIVLPDACYLERLDLPSCGSLPGRGDWACQVRRPAVPPPFERRYSPEVLLEIGERLGIVDAMNAALNDLYGLRPPDPLEPGERNSWEEMIDRTCRGWFGPKHGLAWFRENGVLARPKRLEEAYPTRRGRATLHPERLARLGEGTEPNPHIGFDLQAVSYRVPWHTASRTRENPWLDEISQGEPYGDFVCLNPRAAAVRGIADGDTVWVESTNGRRVRGHARLTEGVHPEAVAIVVGGGHWARGMPIAQGRGAFFNALMTSGGARVRVYKE